MWYQLPERFCQIKFVHTALNRLITCPGQNLLLGVHAKQVNVQLPTNSIDFSHLMRIDEKVKQGPVESNEPS